MTYQAYLCSACRRASRCTPKGLRPQLPGEALHRRTFATSRVQPAARGNEINYRRSLSFSRSVGNPKYVTPTQTVTIRRHEISSRAFSTSSLRTAAIVNPRQDEDGSEMKVEITSRASRRLKEIMTTDSNPNLALRVSVESGGCHGFQYLMSLTEMSKIDKEDDTVFEGEHGTKVVMDQPSLELLKGSKIDYTMELIGSQFKIVDNPLATSSCGCGTSFDIKA